ncbi:hypothetical protein AKUH1B105A_PKUN00130 (plasmid) [Apilactobacillus kunkeei]|nr:hypothetical protein AKUH1B105A_PKUN00130 [Apilactobacillus kunkeei]
MQYGYARVSTLGQSLDNQIQDLRDNGVLKRISTLINTLVLVQTE